MQLTKKQRDLLNQLTERRETIEQHFNEWLTWQQVCELVGWKYSTSGQTQARQKQQLEMFIDYYDNNETRQNKRYMLTGFLRTFFEETFSLNKLGQIYLLGEKNNEKTYEEKTPTMEEAFAELLDENKFKLKKMIAKSVLDQLFVEAAVEKGNYFDWWFVTKAELLKATGLISHSHYHAIRNRKRFVCCLDLNAWENEGQVIFLDKLPEEIAKLNMDEDTREFDTITRNYIKQHGLEQVLEIVEEVTDVESEWVGDQLQAALKYLSNNLKLIVVHDDAYILQMDISTINDSGRIVTTPQNYYPKTIEEWDWITLQYSTVMQQMGYTSWYKIKEQGKEKLFYIKLVEHINSHLSHGVPYEYGWGKIYRIYKCKVLTFDKQQVAWAVQNHMKLTLEERQVAKQIADAYANHVRDMVLQIRLDKLEKRIQKAITIQDGNKQIMIRRYSNYRPVAYTVVRELYCSKTTYRWWKQKTTSSVKISKVGGK